MVLGTHLAVASGAKLTEKPEQLGPALAQIIQVNADQEVVLGQAWLAAPNQLVTCGHVVEAFVNDPSGLFLYFPGSGRRYPVKSVRLHPSFVRQPEGIVKFDAAVVSAQLLPPDSLAEPLPFSFERTLRTNQPLWAIRYPVHLGQLSAALQPLAQEGRFLGYLRKHDNFHLLHDLPLSPGDSGALITDGKAVVALHCGDTATLPGINLPTTSIRLGLWIDALRELDLHATNLVARRSTLNRAPIAAALTALLACVVSFMAVTALSRQAPLPVAPVPGESMAALNIKFNNKVNAYRAGEELDVTINVTRDCYPFFFLANPQGRVLKLFPRSASALVKPEYRDVDVSHDPQSANDTGGLDLGSTDCTLTALVVDAANRAAVENATQGMKDASMPLGAVKMNQGQLMNWLDGLKAKYPGAVSLRVFPLTVTKTNL